MVKNNMKAIAILLNLFIKKKTHQSQNFKSQILELKIYFIHDILKNILNDFLKRNY